MSKLRTYNEIIADEQPNKLFLIAANPNWTHYSPDSLPIPIQNWLDTHFPNTSVERVAGFDPHFGICDLDGDSDIQSTLELPYPLFLVGIDETQADILECDWKATFPPPANGIEDFWLLEFSSASENVPLPRTVSG